MPPTTIRPDASLLSISNSVAIAAWPITLSDGGSDSRTLLSRTPACEEEFPTAAAFRCARSSARVSSSCSQFQLALLDPARRSDQDQQDPLGGERNDLDVPYRRVTECRILHDRHLLGHLSEQLDGSVQHVVEIEGTREERLDGALFGRRQRLHRTEPVHEQPITLVGGNPAGASVRLGDVALFLQSCHVVANRRGRDTEVVPLDQHLGP